MCSAPEYAHQPAHTTVTRNCIQGNVRADGSGTEDVVAWAARAAADARVAAAEAAVQRGEKVGPSKLFACPRQCNP
jgi:hypothetical protein